MSDPGVRFLPLKGVNFDPFKVEIEDLGAPRSSKSAPRVRLKLPQGYFGPFGPKWPIRTRVRAIFDPPGVKNDPFWVILTPLEGQNDPFWGQNDPFWGQNDPPEGSKWPILALISQNLTLGQLFTLRQRVISTLTGSKLGIWAPRSPKSWPPRSDFYPRRGYFWSTWPKMIAWVAPRPIKNLTPQGQIYVWPRGQIFTPERGKFRPF